MAYTRGIPGPNDSVSVWQKQEQRNNLIRDDVFGEEHYPFSDPDNGGKHRRFVMPAESSDPTTLSDEYALYTKESGGVLSIYTREPSDGNVGNIIDDNTFGNVQRIGDFIVGASCSWDVNGNFFNPYNVQNITVIPIPPQGDFVRYQINFIDILPTSDYFWSVDFFNGPNNINFPSELKGIFTSSNASYGNVVKDDSISFTILKRQSSIEQKRNKFTMKAWLIA